MSLYSIIFATDNEKEMKSKLPASLQPLCGKTLIERIIGNITDAGSERNIIVAGQSADKIKEFLGNSVDYINHKENTDAIYSVMQCISLINDCKGNIIIMNSNTPLVTAETLSNAYKEHIADHRSATVITAYCRNSVNNGKSLPDNKMIINTVEHTDFSVEKFFADKINSGIYIFNIQSLKLTLSHLLSNNSQCKHNLINISEVMLKNGEDISFYVTDIDEITAVHNKAQLSYADSLLNRRNVNKLMADGVSVLNPETVRIGDDVKIGLDTVIYPNTILEGNTQIGEDCIIGPNTKITNCIIGNNTEIQSSVALHSTIGSCTNVGPFAYVRPNSKIGNNIKVGDFVEVKNASIGNNTKISHLTYVGDADVGERVNFGCGTVIVNYDGIHKHRATIEDDCFIGCNTNLVSPVTLRKGAYTAAGSTITEEVPSEALAIARSRQIVKEGWAKGKKK